jgi:hypothetical protein
MKTLETYYAVARIRNLTFRGSLWPSAIGVGSVCGL